MSENQEQQSEAGSETDEDKPSRTENPKKYSESELLRIIWIRFLCAFGWTSFLFGLLGFTYVVVTIYVIHGAAVDWYIHHTLPWLQHDHFAGITFVAAFFGLIIANFFGPERRKMPSGDSLSGSGFSKRWLFLFSLFNGKNPQENTRWNRLLLAIAKSMLVFGLIGFAYAFFSVHVYNASSFVWYIHHWTPWFKVGDFTVVSFLGAAFGFFMIEFLEGRFWTFQFPRSNLPAVSGSH